MILLVTLIIFPRIKNTNSFTLTQVWKAHSIGLCLPALRSQQYQAGELEFHIVDYFFAPVM